MCSSNVAQVTRLSMKHSQPAQLLQGERQGASWACCQSIGGSENQKTQRTDSVNNMCFSSLLTKQGIYDRMGGSTVRGVGRQVSDQEKKRAVRKRSYRERAESLQLAQQQK